MAFLLAVGTFVIVVAILGLVFLLATGGQPKDAVRRRLESIEKSRARGHNSLELQLVRDELMSDLPLLHQWMLRWSWSKRLRAYIAQSGLKIKPGKLLMLSGILSVVSFLVARQMAHSTLIALAAGAGAAFLPYAFVAYMRMRRLHAFEKNFPEAIDLLGRAVRAGHAFSTGLEMIGQEIPEPVAQEFRTLFEEQNFGLPLKEALLNLTERVPIIDVQFFVVVILIQKETGGNLAEILDNLARVIRERFKIYGEVRTRTAQGRMTAGILISLPPIMILMLSMLNPDYIKVLLEDPWGINLIIGAAVLQVVGSIMLWKIVHIEV